MSQNPIAPLPQFARAVARIWGVGFVTLLFGMGSFRLLRKAWELGSPQGAWEWVLYVVLALAGVAKAFVIFQRHFVPRTLARAWHETGCTGSWLDVPLAPLITLSLLRPWQRKDRVISGALIVLMPGLAVACQYLGQPWRGAIDTAVGAALGWAVLLYARFLLVGAASLCGLISADRVVPRPETARA